MGSEVKVLYFASAAEATGKSQEIFNAGDTVSLRRQLTDKYPSLKLVPFRLALNKVLLKGESELRTNDTVALLPPFQGG